MPDAPDSAMIVDAHQHFWDPARGDYGWLTPDSPIHRVFGTGDLRPLLVTAGVDATILVQAAPTPAETDYMLAIAARRRLRAGRGGLDRSAGARCRRPSAPPRRAIRMFLGVRPMLQDLPDPDWILQPGAGARAECHRRRRPGVRCPDPVASAGRRSPNWRSAIRSSPSCWIMPPSRGWAMPARWRLGARHREAGGACPMSPARSPAC